eukprot:XP_022268788.1 uncharacterized protein LOC102152474 [Canis lupus familiaris]
MALDFRYLSSTREKSKAGPFAPPPPAPGVSPGCGGSLRAAWAWDWQRGPRNLHLKARPGRPRDGAREALVPATPDAAESPTGEDSLDRGLRWTQGRRSSGGAEAKNRFQETETSSGGCAASSSSAFTPALCPRSFSSLPVSRVQGFLSRQQLQGCCDARLGRIGLAHVTFLPPLPPQCQTHCSLDPFHVREGPGAIALDQEVGRSSRLRTKVKIGMGRKRKRMHHVLLIAREASLVSLAPMQPLPGFPSC